VRDITDGRTDRQTMWTITVAGPHIVAGQLIIDRLIFDKVRARINVTPFYGSWCNYTCYLCTCCEQVLFWQRLSVSLYVSAENLENYWLEIDVAFSFVGICFMGNARSDWKLVTFDL